MVPHQEVHCAEEGGEEERTPHVQLCEGIALEAQQEDCYGALEDALQVYSQLCTIHNTAQSTTNSKDNVGFIRPLETQAMHL